MKKRIMAAVLTGMMVFAVGCGSSNAGKITVGQYKGLEVTSVTEDDVQAEIKAVLDDYATLELVDRAAQEGDTVNINYVGTQDGVAFEGGTDDSEEGTNLELGSNAFIDGFEDGLIGAVAGEVRELNLTFPDPYQNNPDLAGQAVVFTVTVNTVKETIVPELTDEFVSEYIGGYTTAQEYVDSIRETLNTNTYRQQILESLMDSSTVEEYDENAVKTEKENMVNSYKSYAEMYASYLGLDTDTALYYFFGFENTEALETYAGEYAYELEKQDMIMDAIAKEEGIEITDEIYEEKAAALATQYGYETIEAMETDNTVELIKEIILSELVMNYLIEQAVIVE